MKVRTLSSIIGAWAVPTDINLSFLDDYSLCLVLHHEKIGYVTVDMDQRVFDLGYCRPSRKWGSKTYAGRSWRVDLLNDAEKSLRGIK